MTSDEKALHGMVYQLEGAWNAADSASFAALFAEDADFIHILGGYYTGRAAIEAGHRMIFGTIYKGSTVRYSVEKIRFVRPDVADSLRSASSLQFYEDGTARELEATAAPSLQKKTRVVADRGAPKHKDYGSWRADEGSKFVILSDGRSEESKAPYWRKQSPIGRSVMQLSLKSCRYRGPSLRSG